MKNIAISLALLMFLAACQPAAVAESQAIIKACQDNKRGDAGLCECIGQRSIKENLTSEEREIVRLMLSNQGDQDSVIKKYPMPSIAGAGKFLGVSMAVCTAEMMK